MNTNHEIKEVGDAMENFTKRNIAIQIEMASEIKEVK